MKNQLLPSADHLVHISKFYASVAIAAALGVLVVALLVGKPLLLPGIVLGFLCGRYQKKIVDALSSYWRGLCEQNWMSNGTR